MTTIYFTNKDYDTNGNGRLDYETQYEEFRNLKQKDDSEITAIWVCELVDEPEFHCNHGPAIITPQVSVVRVFGTDRALE